ncbi:hypothetical protein CNY89_02830 [Amaricoccus sp. HAR-UPW-R2A-40]|nr:hypothetical protein CNY89_02830 [Amaricoccus sp. HAR-UPW-R2A-40]
MLTERQIEKSTIGLWAAGGLAFLLVSQAVGLTLYLSGIKGSVAAVDAKIEAVQSNQVAGQQRAEQRQAATESRIDEVVEVSRDRNNALDARIRPLETQAAATTATLQSINNNLLQLGADMRELGRAMRESDKAEDKKP